MLRAKTIELVVPCDVDEEMAGIGPIVRPGSVTMRCLSTSPARLPSSFVFSPVCDAYPA